MRSLFALIVVAAACSHSAPTASPALTHTAAPWRGPEILATVPADTPYFFGVLEPSPAGVRDLMFAHSGAQLATSLRKMASGEGKGALLAAALYQEIDGVAPKDVLEKLGFPRNGRMVLYGLSIWPVLRMEIKDEARVRQILARLVQASGSELQPRTVGSAMLYTLTTRNVTWVFGVVGRQLVAAIVPADSLDHTLPLIIGTELPAQSLRDAPVLPSLLARHRFLPQSAGYLDSKRVLEAFSGHGKGTNDKLAAMFENKVAQSCFDDAGRIASAMPRIVLGYSRLDEQGFTVTLGLETPPAVGKSLVKLRAPMPAIPTTPAPMFAMAAAVDIDATIAWLHDVTAQLHANPFRCDAFADVNHATDSLAAELDKPLPAMFQGLRGGEVVVDDLTILPPSGSGELMIEGAHLADAVRQQLAKVPQIALNITADGHAVELPLAQMGLPPTISSAHFALRPTRAVVAVGDDSARRATARVAAPAGRAPLFAIVLDLAKLRARFPDYFKEHDLDQLASMTTTELTVDVGDDGIAFEMVGTWAHGR